MTSPKPSSEAASGSRAPSEQPMVENEPLHSELVVEGSDEVAAPTEPALALGVSTGAPLEIKRATVYSDTDPTDGAAQPLRHIESYVGFVLDGRYHIESIIAQGGMGVVYLARHRLIDKHVAVKILRPELANNREITARFLTEAQAASAIGSEHIVNVTDFGELPDGATYIVMEYLNGLSLNQRIRKDEGLLPIPVVLDIARQIAEGLQRAHDANIVHRDLKPDNILLVTKGRREDFVKILDFGIAKVQSSQNHTTTAGRIFGTPHYMSPEQGRGQELNHRTDIYSLGVILYEMVCASVPFEGENPLGILTQHMYVDAKPLSERCSPERVTPALECVVARCMLKDPTGRYASMSELDEDLRRLQEFEPPLAVEYFRTAPNPPAYLLPLLRRAGSSKPRRRSWLFGFSLAALTLLGGLWYRYTDGFAPEAPNDPQVPAETTVAALAVVEVTIVAEPIDAHIFEDERDLGVNPHTLQLVHQQPRTVTVRRSGYRDLTLVVDGSQTRVEAKLRRITGPEPLRSGERGSDVPTAAAAASLQSTTPSEPTLQSPASLAPVPSAPPPVSEATTSTALPSPPAIMQPPDAIDPAWGYAPEPPGPPPTAQAPAPITAGGELGPIPTPQSDPPNSPASPPGPPPLDR